MSVPPEIRIDKTAAEVFDSFNDAAAKDRQYWLTQSPIERLAAC
jgi:hypothetical protein